MSFATQKASHKINDKDNHIYDISPSVCNKIFKRKLIGNYRFLEGCKWEDIAFIYQQNTSIMEIFRVTDKLIQGVIIVGKYEEYKESLNLICISYILKRVVN